MNVIEGNFGKENKKDVIAFLEETLNALKEDEDEFETVLLSLQTKEGRTITSSNTDFETSIVLATVCKQVIVDLYMGQHL